MSIIANKAFPSKVGDNYQEFPPIKRRRSFSSLEQATYKKPISIDTKTAFSKPSLSIEEVESLVERAKALGCRSDMMITYEFTKEAFKRLSLPYSQREAPLISEKTAVPYFEWNLVPCEFIKARRGRVVVTENHAIRISELEEKCYYLELENEEAIIKKINPYNEGIGLSPKNITRLGMKKFYLYEQKADRFYMLHKNATAHKPEVKNPERALSNDYFNPKS